MPSVSTARWRPTRPQQPELDLAAGLPEAEASALAGSEAAPMGATLLYLAIGNELNAWMAGLGALLLVLGVYSSRQLVRSVRRFRAIVRA